MGYIENNKKLIKKLENNDYFKPAVKLYNETLNYLQTTENLSEKSAEKEILNHLKNILWNSQGGVNLVIKQRIDSGKIKDASQARKSVAGNNFQKLVAYSLARNILIGNITGKVFVDTSTKNNKIIKDYATITVGNDGDVQKPDSDILLYTENEKEPIINFSCKTSLRERAGQTYKWKLLVDIASCKCDHSKNIKTCPINLYNIRYNNSRKIYMCFVTSDLYEEINNPQTSGMFNFFDKAYITKKTTEFSNKNILSFSEVINFLNDTYK